MGQVATDQINNLADEINASFGQRMLAFQDDYLNGNIDAVLEELAACIVNNKLYDFGRKRIDNLELAVDNFIY